MQVVIDVETDKLIDPTKIWVIVCKDIDTYQTSIFRNVTDDNSERERFLKYCEGVTKYIGHNFLGFDYPVLCNLLDFRVDDILKRVTDTLVISKLVDYSRPSHSIEQYGEEFGLPKGKFIDFSKYSQEMEDYCVRDVDICHRIYSKYLAIINDMVWAPSIFYEQWFQLVVNRLHSNGFSFNVLRARNLLDKVNTELAILDKQILETFLPKTKLIREVHPKVTKHGTLSKTDFRFVKNGDVSEYNGGPFSRFSWSNFNPASHLQVVTVLNEAGWKPVDKTQTFVDTERELNRLKYIRGRTKEVDLRIQECHTKIIQLEKLGWKVNENNLGTLPSSAPAPARTLARRILYESRRRTLTEWLALVQPDGRIHGTFYALGAWTHRMAHQKPNTANIPNDKKEDGSTKLLGKELRSLWQAPRRRLLVGVDAEGIQLRIFAHYIDDKEFTEALVNGKKSDKTDPHSLNKSILGEVCKTRQAAKRFVYALLLGGGIGKLAQILECEQNQAKEALDRLLERYSGFAYLKREVIPNDAKRGYFIGLDGRKVRIPGDTVGERKHLCMSGYLQNGEAIVMKRATLKWHDLLAKEDAILVNFVHDEWQTETPNNMEVALRVARMQADSLRQVGEDLHLKCPLAGSYYNEDLKDYTIASNWAYTH